jgi:hypothetical protein
MGGRILGREKRKGEDHESLVLHDIPLQDGDGGGPLVDADARLIGVNVRARPPILRFLLPGIQYPPSDAERPDGKWPAEIIDKGVATPRPRSLRRSSFSPHLNKSRFLGPSRNENHQAYTQGGVGAL